MTRKRSGEPRIKGWPPRPCINDEHRRLKREKLNYELDELVMAEMAESDKAAMEEADCFFIAERIKAVMRKRKHDYKEIFSCFSAWSKRPEPQQKMIEKLVSEEARGRKPNPALAWASEQLDRANQILREVYGGRPQKDDHPTKEEIIVERWNNDIRPALEKLPALPLTVDQLVEYRRKGRPKYRRKGRPKHRG